MAVTDVVSPRDASEFIFFNIEDARFGQWNVSSTLYRDNTSLFVFFTPLPEIDKTPEAGTHYFRSLPGNKNGCPVDDSPEFGDMEAGIKPLGTFMAVESNVLDGAAGIEYNANDAYFMSLELSNRHIFSDRSALVHGRQDTASLYYTLTKDFWHDTLTLEYNFYYHLQEKNHFHNFQATYDLTDTIEIQVRYTLLNVTDSQSLMWAYKDEDRVAMEIQFTF